MPATQTTLDDLTAAAAAATANVTAAQQRIDDARAEVRAAALEHYQTVMASLQPASPAHASSAKARTATAAAAVPTLDALEQRVRKALADYQQVCRDLGV